jgi:hypothetical protein
MLLEQILVLHWVHWVSPQVDQLVQAVWRPGWLAIGAGGAGHFRCAMLCDVLLNERCIVFDRKEVCELAWFEEDGMFSNKGSSQRRMRTRFCKRSMDVTKTSDILTMSGVSTIRAIAN